ncbi:MAG: phage Gp37/Gp68 family protein [Anaerolineaceae bacterium]|nr:phage Gp37/Gp68 family protein [Anaerolineaceae bacterium]
MSNHSGIEWTESTWNPITGCTKISQGCKHCYAERMAMRLKAMGQHNYSNGFKLTLHDHVLQLPLTWKQPQVIFVNSMSDLFHEEVPLEFIEKIFNVMKEASWHTFQILTKRSSRLVEVDSQLDWPKNVWMGVTVESQVYDFRIDDLRQSHAQVKFLSLEPLLGPITNLNLSDIKWVITGGESGPGARPIEQKWVIDIRDQCITSSIPFFFKQWGGVRKKRNGRLLEGKIWSETPQFAI